MASQKLDSGFLALHSAFARHRAFGGSIFSVFLRMNTQVVPRRFREVDAVVVCSFLDVRERQSTVGIGDVDDLIEPRDRVTHMLCVGQWFFTLLRKRVDTVWQVALRREWSVFLVRFPSCFRHVFAVLSLISDRSACTTTVAMEWPRLNQ